MTRVGISAVAAVRGDFQRLFVDDHGERAVRGSGLVGAIALPFENALHVLPVGLRGDVDIGGRPPEQRVADVSAHYPRLEAGVFERIEGGKRALRQRDDDGRIEVGLVRHGASSFHSLPILI